jgi:hypothetical protein
MAWDEERYQGRESERRKLRENHDAEWKEAKRLFSLELVELQKKHRIGVWSCGGCCGLDIISEEDPNIKGHGGVESFYSHDVWEDKYPKRSI